MELTLYQHRKYMTEDISLWMESIFNHIGKQTISSCDITVNNYRNRYSIDIDFENLFAKNKK